MDAPAKDKPKTTISGKPINQAPGMNQLLVTSEIPFEDVLKADKAGKHLVFDILDFPEYPRLRFAELSPQARSAYQMDMRNANTATQRMENGEDPFESRIQAINKKDPLSRKDEAKRKGEARTLPPGMKHLNVGTHEVEELERVGYRRAKADEVDIVGGVKKGEGVVLMGQNGKVDNVTMIVEKESYDKHRKANWAKTDERIHANLESTKESMKQFNPRVTIFDKSDLARKK